MRLPSILLLLVSAVLLQTGCSVFTDAHTRKMPVMDHYLTGNLPDAAQILADKAPPPDSAAAGKRDEISWRLEAGALAFLQGDYAASISQFARCSQLIEEYDERAVVSFRDVSAESGAILVNPTVLPYRGLCRDRVLIPVYRGLAYLGSGSVEGFRTELFALRQVQDQLLQDYQEVFDAEEDAARRQRQENRAKMKGEGAALELTPDEVICDSRNAGFSVARQEASAVAQRGYADFLNPLAIFLSAYGFAREGDYQNALVDYERLYKALPNHPLIQQYYAFGLQAAGRRVPGELRQLPPLGIASGRGTVLVIFANGRSAALRQESVHIPIVLPHYETVMAAAFPVCEFYPAPYSTLQLFTNDGISTETQTIADMDGILAAEYLRRLPGVLTRLIVGTVAKEIASYVIVQAARNSNSEHSEAMGLLAELGTSLYKISVNVADTRSWEILPKEFQIAEVPLPADRLLTLLPPGGEPAIVQIPESAGSAIIYYNAPSDFPGAASCHVMALP